MSKRYQVAAIGEVLWDVFPDQQRMGGAPANFATHLARLAGADASVSLMSAVGDDPLAEQTLVGIGGLGLSTDSIQRSNHPTGKVNVSFNQGAPEYEIAHPAAWDDLRWTPQMESIAKQADAICFGTLAQRAEISRDTIQRFVAATSPHCMRMLDINLRPTMDDPQVFLQSLELATMLKLSDEELPVLAKLLGLGHDANLQSQLKQLAQRFDLQLIAYTQGGDGATLVQGNRICKFGGVETTVVDTVGAGDSFTATLVWELLQGRSLEIANENACRVAAFVCSQKGATPEIPAGVYQ
jgi:fructokinase